MKSILVIDNYDSFTYNLVHIIQKQVTTKVAVYRNDKIDIETINEYDKIVLSPGPGIPSEAGLLLPIIQTYAASKSFLGVCLGHQAIGEVFGAKLENLNAVYHGISTPVYITHPQMLQEPRSVFFNLSDVFEAARYHSWIISKENFPEELIITAVDDHNNIMAVQHKHYDVQGVQFHPESVLTPLGEKMIINWLNN